MRHRGLHLTPDFAAHLSELITLIILLRRRRRRTHVEGNCRNPAVPDRADAVEGQQLPPRRDVLEGQHGGRAPNHEAVPQRGRVIASQLVERLSTRLVTAEDAGPQNHRRNLEQRHNNQDFQGALCPQGGRKPPGQEPIPRVVRKGSHGPIARHGAHTLPIQLPCVVALLQQLCAAVASGADQPADRHVSEQESTRKHAAPDAWHHRGSDAEENGRKPYHDSWSKAPPSVRVHAAARPVLIVPTELFFTPNPGTTRKVNCRRVLRHGYE